MKFSFMWLGMDPSLYVIAQIGGKDKDVDKQKNEITRRTDSLSYI